MAPHSSTFAQKIPWTEEPGRLQSMGLQRVGHDWATELNWTEPEKEFRIMIVKIIKNFENKLEKMQDSINKDLEELKNKHREKQ